MKSRRAGAATWTGADLQNVTKLPVAQALVPICMLGVHPVTNVRARTEFGAICMAIRAATAPIPPSLPAVF